MKYCPDNSLAKVNLCEDRMATTLCRTVRCAVQWRIVPELRAMGWTGLKLVTLQDLDAVRAAVSRRSHFSLQEPAADSWSVLSG